MLKNRGRDPRSAVPSTPTLSMRSTQRAPMARPEPDYEVVEFPTEQYVNAKLQPPPPPPPRPSTGHPPDAGSSCGLCGGGNARVRCTECGRRALCASCDDMYHRHPKRRNHQRQALSHLQLRDERPPLPPKSAPPVPPPRRHKMSGDRSTASPIPPTSALDHRRTTLSLSTRAHKPMSPITNTNHFATQRQFHNPHQTVPTMGAHMGSMPYLPGTIQQTNTPIMTQDQNHTMGHFVPSGRPRGSIPGFNVPTNIVQSPHFGPWEAQENLSNSWGRPLRRGTSVMELGGVVPAPTGCSGCAHCASNPWRYGSCANLEHSWGQGPWPQTCCGPHPSPHNPQLIHHHGQPLQTPQPYRGAESRIISRAASRASSRAVSPVCSIRSRASRRSKHRSPSPIALPSSDADSESENESDHQESQNKGKDHENSLGPAPPPATATWQCEHCTFVNEPGVRVCTVCCKTPTTKPKIIPTEVLNNGLSKLKFDNSSPPSSKNLVAEPFTKKETRGNKTRYSTERTSTACGPSPPRDNRAVSKSINRLTTPTRENSNERIDQSNSTKQVRHDISVGPSPPKELNKQQVLAPNANHLVNSPTDTPLFSRRDTPSIEIKKSHSVSVGPSPPRESLQAKSSSQKKSVGNSPFRDNIDTRPTSRSSRTSTGTSPPPQSISTQTYEVPTNWDREQSITRSRPRRRFRDENQRERSHSRLSLSSDTRESERSTRTSGGRWEWREPRDSSPSGGGDWSDSEKKQDKTRLTRRASHLDLRRGKPSRRSSIYSSEIPSPESMTNNRAISLEALAGAGSRREAEKGLELARLMSEAERLGFSAAEVHAALAQNPAAPLAWLRERWPSLCAGVRAAAARLAPGVNVTELEARASLAKHRGAMWPAVNDCVERYRRQADSSSVGEERRLRGHVWGPPIGADDDAAPQYNSSGPIHRHRAEDSSDEFEGTVNKFQDDDWMYLPLQTNPEISYEFESPKSKEYTNATNDIAEKLKALLKEAGIPLIDETLLLNGLLANNSIKTVDTHKDTLEQVTPSQTDFIPIENSNVTPVFKKPHSTDLLQSENDFIDAYNALTRLSPLPNVKNDVKIPKIKEDSQVHQKKTSNENTNINKLSHSFVNNGNQDSFENINFNVDQRVDSEYDNNNIKSSSDNNNRPTNQNRNIEQDYIHKENSQALTEIDGKQNNLSDIVDNTQKLIQQMKKEINLDINLVQDKSDNESESNNSSDDLTNDELSSDKESSYSGSETDSEELSSDEKEVFSNKRENFSKPLKLHISDNRTSSEDNENFEEAMDHVENEMENFKQTNIEMLNSIARSLNEEHTLSVEINNANQRNQDINNNLFLAVDTFEEIYAQLDTKQPENKDIIEKPNNSPALLKEKQIYNTYIKHEMESLKFIPQFPIKLEIVENKYQSLNALIEDIPDTLENIENINENNRDNFIPINEITHTLTLEEALVNDNGNVGHNTVDEGLTELIERDSSKSSSSTIIENVTINNNVTDSTNNNEIKILNTEDMIQKHKETIILLNSSNSDLSTSKENERLKAPTITNKSNIPKLIKTIQTTKQKADRNYPKVIASKVPVRRGSLKHYPAPNPPKNHFGNVLSGHVKQLQTRLFNNKTTKTNPSKPLVSGEASTSSTISKKKTAPPPPNQDKQCLSQETLINNKNKNSFFRETCRTEDEWTESDVEEPTKIITSTAEENINQMVISQAQPITMRHVSGQLIDLTQVRLPEGSPERQARMLLAEGATETWEQAQLAVKLILQGTETPSALLAALECTDLPSALAYLNQDCELCASKYPEHEMVSMLRCTHRCCQECARYYFTVQITERSIADCVCPFCKEPELENLPEDAWLDYFANMDILLKTLLDPDIHELFQRKLRDRTLARDPNFKWCIECSSGFFVHPKQKRLRCPECKSITCASCRKPWSSNHEGITCDQYSAWLEDNDPERSVAAVQQHLRENGLECPRCHFKYSLSRGGCMHFTCTQCKYEFCYGCGKPFTMGARCGLSEYCAKLGLHAHHPRNCLFYLRDKEPHELQTLLQMNNVTYEIEAPESNSGRCPIQLQRETPGGLVDAICGSEVLVKNAGLCKMHYLEYLAGLARALDPIPIMDVSELVAELRRRALPLPERGPWDTDPIYAGMCAEIVREKIPLD